MNSDDLTVTGVVFDAQRSVADSLIRELTHAQLWTADGVTGTPARRLYEQTRLDLLTNLVEHLTGLVNPDVIRMATAEYAHYFTQQRSDNRTLPQDS